MNIVIHSMGMPFNGETLKTRSLGGSESAAYYQARALAKRGHKVTVFTLEREEGIFDGVSYCFIGNVNAEAPLGDRFEFYAQNTPHDVLIIQRHPQAFHKKWASKVNVHQMHDLALHRYSGQIHHGLWQTDAITVVSDFHNEQLRDVYGIKPSCVLTIPNGVDDSLYAEEDFNACDLFPKGDYTALLYQSRPERGLEHLVRPDGIMARLEAARPGKFKLLYCSYDNTTAQMAPFYAQLNAWAAALPNVVNLGSLNKATLASVQQQCDFLFYPTEFEEVSCITAMEAMHAGLPMITSDVGALKETCEGSGTILIPLKDGRADEDAFVNEILAQCDHTRATLVARQRKAAKKYTWDAVAEKMEQALEELFARKITNGSAIIRTAIERSDISFARAIRQKYPEIADSGIGRAAIRELDTMYAFSESDEAYEAHYAKHQGEYYDGPGADVVGEDVTPMTRFRGVVSLLQNVVERKGSKLKVLDYGCAHGHFIVPLSKMFPECEFVGMDISSRAIGKALQWIMQEGITNVSLSVGTSADLQEREKEFDVIIACEVIEHVNDEQRLIKELRHVLKDDGEFIATTPYGRWEWIGTEAFKNGREHLHHFDKEDIEEMLAPFKHTIICAPSGKDQGHESIGSWVWSFTNNSWDAEVINFERKQRYYAPRSTISACLIVKNANNTIGSCLDSFIDMVDEVVVLIDPKTTDDTHATLLAYEKKHPFKSFVIDYGLSALEEGFDAARNATIERASGDWIMWIDADEMLHRPWNIHQLLRTSANDGYAFAQVHYAAEPAQVLTTDMPCRLFRNRLGVRFFGVVHEHPETEIGKAVPHTMIRHDSRFLHNGYTDEETRRGRYYRNLPLLHRDLKKHPHRVLSKFLMLRDISQGIAFDFQTLKGNKPYDADQRALEGIKLFEQLLETEQLRIVIDAVQYYSGCVETLGTGFNAEYSIKTNKEGAPDVSVHTTVNGRFLNKEHYFKLIDRITKESVKHYESRYL